LPKHILLARFLLFLASAQTKNQMPNEVKRQNLAKKTSEKEIKAFLAPLNTDIEGKNKGVAMM